MVKQLFNDIKTRLESITELGDVDLLKNKPIVAASITDFPAAFIDFRASRYKNSSAQIQLGDLKIRIILCYESAELIDTAALFDLKNEIFSKIQGAYTLDPPEIYAILTRTKERSRTKYPELFAYEIEFSTTIKDKEVYTKKNLQQAPQPLELTITKTLNNDPI